MQRPHYQILFVFLVMIISLVTVNCTTQGKGAQQGAFQPQAVGTPVFLPLINRPIYTVQPTSNPTNNPTSNPTKIPTSNPTSINPTSVSPTKTPLPPNPNAIIADHTVIAVFEQIPDYAVADAANLNVLFMHRSVGEYIRIEGLDYLQGTNSKYNRQNWDWPLFGAQTFPTKIEAFTSEVNSSQQNYDVLGMKFCYIDWWQNDFATYRDMMLELQAKYPSKKFIWATGVLYSNWSDGHDPTDGGIIQDFNESLREYASTHNIILYDLADIESTATNGSHCTNNGYESMCSEYLGEPETGHPNTEGAIRFAKGFWWLMARISGWE